MPPEFVTIQVPAHILEASQITPEDLKITLARQMYSQKQLTLEQAAELAALSPGEFEQLLTEPTEQEIAERLPELDDYNVRLLRKLCHELKGRFSIIFGFSHALLKGRDGSLTDGQKQHVTTIQDQTEDMAGLTTDIIDLVKMGQNEVPIRFEAVDLGHLLQKGLAALARPVTIQTNVPADLPAVWGDELRLQQVINNIARTLSGPSKETTMRLDTDYDRQWVWLKISSPEISFKSETLELFGQDDALAAVALPPADWALLVSHDLIKRQGGGMALENQADGGARITLKLPRSSPDET